MGNLRYVGAAPSSNDALATKKYVDDGLVLRVANASGQTLTLWKGTQAQYDAIGSKDANTVYIVTA